MKIIPMETELFHENGRKDTMKLIATFRNFANAPKMDVLNVRNTYEQIFMHEDGN
jgi:hypothetical protein